MKLFHLTISAETKVFNINPSEIAKMYKETGVEMNSIPKLKF